MNSDAKNITNYLVESETLPMFALPKSDECITDTYFKNAHKSVSLCSNLFCRLSLFGEKRGYALFCIHITKLFNTKCQRVKKLVSNWGIIVSSPRNPFASTANYSVNSSLSSKNLQEKFAELETLCIFVMPKDPISGITKSYERSLGVFLLHFCTRSRGLLAKKGTRSLYVLTNTCVQRCQKTTQADLSGRIVPILHPFASTVNYSVISVPYRQCARLTNRNYPTKPTKYRYARLLRRRLTVLKKTLNLQTYTRLRTRYMRSAGLWRILTIVSSTYRSILNQLESLFDREPLLMPI